MTAFTLDEMSNSCYCPLTATFQALLPDPTATIPRDKPLPQEKEQTRWEEFADQKGIKKRKRERMIYDESDGKWKPNWGYKVFPPHTPALLSPLSDLLRPSTDCLHRLPCPLQTPHYSLRLISIFLPEPQSKKNEEEGDWAIEMKQNAPEDINPWRCSQPLPSSHFSP